MTTIPPSSHREPPLGTLDALNRACFCFSLDQDALAQALDSELGQPAPALVTGIDNPLD